MTWGSSLLLVSCLQSMVTISQAVAGCRASFVMLFAEIPILYNLSHYLRHAQNKIGFTEFLDFYGSCFQTQPTTTLSRATKLFEEFKKYLGNVSRTEFEYSC